MNEETKDTVSGEATTPIQQQGGGSYAVPGAIIIAGALIALAVLYSGKGVNVRNNNNNGQPAPSGEMRQVTDKDHIRGNPQADVVIVEYSDLECPFCKTFHETLLQVMDKYGKDGKVAWVYRHLPLEQIHPKARQEAKAAECAAKLGGQEKFWAYIDRVFSVTPSNNKLDPNLLPTFATELGLDKGAFQSCLDSDEFDKVIDADIQDALSVGAQGTPFSIVVNKSGKKYPINGALPYENVQQVIEMALSNK